MICGHRWEKTPGGFRCLLCNIIGIRRGVRMRTFACTRCGGSRRAVRVEGGLPLCAVCERVPANCPVRILSQGDFSAAEIAAFEVEYGAPVMRVHA